MAAAQTPQSGERVSVEPDGSAELHQGQVNDRKVKMGAC